MSHSPPQHRWGVPQGRRSRPTSTGPSTSTFSSTFSSGPSSLTTSPGSFPHSTSTSANPPLKRADSGTFVPILCPQAWGKGSFIFLKDLSKVDPGSVLYSQLAKDGNLGALGHPALVISSDKKMVEFAPVASFHGQGPPLKYRDQYAMLGGYATVSHNGEQVLNIREGPGFDKLLKCSYVSVGKTYRGERMYASVFKGANGNGVELASGVMVRFERRQDRFAASRSANV